MIIFELVDKCDVVLAVGQSIKNNVPSLVKPVVLVSDLIVAVIVLELPKFLATGVKSVPLANEGVPDT